ncbi:MAG: sensor histidine kinase, partial [Candidatus Acidiferrum sp.]
RYNRNSDIIDAVGNLSFLLILIVVAIRSRGPWRSFYLQMVGATATYSFAAILLNAAIESGRYHTGSIYDLPLNIALAWFCITAITTSVDATPSQDQVSDGTRSERQTSRKRVSWVARLSMLATLSLPVIGLWLVLNGDPQDPVRHFRILLTLFAMLAATLLLSAKQDLLSFSLAGELREASLAYLGLKRFQDQLVQNEKLASLGKLVARVAHEIHEAMVAVGKDVEFLGAPAPAHGRHQKMTAKIGEAALRTNNLVESMLSFAQERPVHRSPVNIRPLLEKAVNLARAERRHKIRVEIEEEGSTPAVKGDANQLVQVFLHIVGNAIDAMEESQPGVLRIAIRARQESVEIEFVDSGAGLQDPGRVFEPFYTTKPVGRGVGLGLSTCYGIIRGHEGEIKCWNRPEGGAVFRLIIPLADAEMALPVS